MSCRPRAALSTPRPPAMHERQHRFGAVLLALAATLSLSSAHAQIQRSFVNLGFELPELGPNTCNVQTRASDVPGWDTTETSTTGAGGCPGFFTPNSGSPGDGVIELWANGSNGFFAAQGEQHAELNATSNARLSQSVCLINGELIGYTMQHRGRGSTTTPDVAEFNIDSAANTVIRASTTSNGTGGLTQCGNTASAPVDGPVAGATDGLVTNPTCSSATSASGWRSYTGSFTWSGTTATHNIGFAAISTGSGFITQGNFLDSVDLTLRPVIEFTSTQQNTPEAGPAAPPAIVVVGTVPTGGIPIVVTITAGTATLGTDFNTTGSVFNIPAGSYPVPISFPLTGLISVIDDAVVEDNETIQLTLQANPAAFVLGSTATCGGVPASDTTYTIVDNDADLLTTKSASTAALVGGVPFQYTVVFRNNTAAPTVAPLTAHDATAAIADALPPGLSFTSWTCTAGNGASCPGGTVNGSISGSGAITGNAILPAGNAAAGGAVTYVIDTLPSAASCSGTVVNTSQITTPAGLIEGTSAQAGFTTPAPGGIANNSASTSGTLSCVAALSISKNDGSATYTPGTGGTYTVVIGNAAGPSVANDVGLSDTLPAGVTLSAAPSCVAAGTATCGTLSGAAGGSSIGMSGGSIAPGAGNTLTVQIPVNFAASLTTNPLVNTATATATGAPDVTANDSNALLALTSLSVVKTDASATYTPGATTTYTITVTNAGPSFAQDVDLSDTLPAGVTLTATPTCSTTGTATCGSISGSAGGSSFSANNGIIAAGAGNSLVYSLPVAFALDLVTTPLVNTATATDPGDATPDSGSDSDTRAALVNLSLVKTATPSGTYLPGAALNYSIVLTNNGPSGASGISFSDTVPATVSVSGWTCTASGANADCDTSTAGTGASGSGNAIALNAIRLNPGESLSIAVTATAQLSATGVIVNTATASPPVDASCTTPPCNVSSSASNTDAGTPQLSLSKQATPSAFAVGQSGTYSLQLSNTGTSSTVGAISIGDPLPTGITSTGTPTGSGWNCAASTATVISCTSTAVLPPGASAPPVTVNVTVGVGTTSPAINTASASGGGDSSCPAAAHCQGTTTTPIDSARLQLVKTLQGNLIVGVQSLYILSVNNTGQAATLAGTISDTIPTGLTIGTLPAGCSAAGQVVTCALPAGIASGNGITYSIPITPQASVNGQSLSNSASVSGGGDASCPAAPRCTGTTTDTVAAPQLSIVKSATPTSFVIGVPATYALQITNIGTAATTATTTVSDTIPSGLAIGTLPAGCSAAGQVVTCTIAAGLATNTPVSFAIPITPDASLADLSVTNSATATGGGDPSCPGGAPSLPPRCIGSVTTPIDAPMLTINKSASGSNFVVGVPASYTLQVTNTGSAATTAVATVSDTIPGALSIGTLPAGCSAAGQVVTCTIAAGLVPGTPVSFVIPVTPTAAASGQVQTNSAIVSGGGDPTCPGAGHCSSTTSTPVNAPLLEIIKNASAANFVVGVPASYTLTVTNIGTAATTALATISDTIPSALNIGTLPPDCSVASQVVTCTIPSGFATGTPLSFVIPVTPTPAASGATLTNSASISGGGDPTCPVAAHCNSTTTTPVNAPLLAITKSASAANFVVGVPASYTLTVTNTGSAATTAVATISDTVPATLNLGTMPPGCSAAGQVVSCTIAAGLAGGTPVSFVIPITPTPAASGSTVSNSASVSGGGDPTCPGQPHCSDTITTPVNAPRLELLKQASANAFVVSVPASYTLTVTNVGSAATTAAATISDTVPAALILGSLPAGCSASGQSVSCTIAAGLGAGASIAFVIPITPSAAASGQTLVNTATVSGGGDPACPAAPNCTSAVSTPVDAPALRLVKTASAASFVVGVPASYILTVTNTGSVATTAAATISDTIPASLALGTPPAGCIATGQTVSCSIPAGLASGTPVSFIIPVTPTAAASGSILTNTAIVSGGGDPSCPAGAACSSTVNTPVDAPQLSVLKTASSPNFVVGVAASYTLTVRNTGNAATTAVATVTDTMAASLTLGTMPAGCSASGQQVTCSIPAGLATGASVAFVIPITPSPAAAGSSVSNSATVSGGGDATCPAAASCTSTTTTPVQAPQLSIVKTASSASFGVGVPASYTLTVTNTGNAATTAAASVTDPIPAVLTLGAPLPVGCSASGQVVTCTIAAGLAAGANTAFVIPVTPQPAAAGASISNTATVSGGGGSCMANNCSSGVITPVGDNADLSIVKSDGGNSAQLGGNVVWTLDVSNAGPSTANNVSVSDTLPTGLTFFSAAGPGWNCAEVARVVTCARPTLASSASSTITLTLSVPLTYTGPNPILNNASVTSDTPDPAPGNNSGGDSTSLLGGGDADVGVLKAGPASANTGGLISYTITVANAGPASAVGVIVTDPTPAGLSLVSISAPCAGGFPCNVGDLANGASLSLNVTYSLPSAYVGANPVTNTASASSSTPDTNTGNNSATVTTTVLGTTPVQPVPLLGTLAKTLLLLLLGLIALAALATHRTRHA